MCNRFFSMAFDRLSAELGQAGARPDMLGREALLFNTLLMLGAIAIAYPVAFYMLALGLAWPVLVVTAGLVLAALALVFHMRRAFEPERACHVALIGAAGCGLALADPDILDFGVAIATMAALKALMVSRSPYRHLAWLAPLAALALSVAGHGGQLAAIAPSGGPDWLFGVIAAYVAVVTVIALAADRFDKTPAPGTLAQMQTSAMLVESVQDAVVRYDAEGRLVFLSRSSATLFNCARYELDGEGFFERVHVMDRPAYRAAISDAGTRGIQTSVEIRMRRDGVAGSAPGFLWIELSLSPAGEAHGARRDVVGILRDISDRKQAEGALEKARVDAEQASQAKSRFLATVGHELRTPLNAIVGFSDMMSAGIGGDASPQHKEYAALISQSGHHLLQVVNMLLDMSKIEAGKFEVHAEPFSPLNLIEPCIRIVDKAARDRDVDISVDAPATLPLLVGDERACRQILINLLSNAVKFSHAGGTVRLSMKRQGRMLLIAVQDSGVGMKADTVRRIGEPFLQDQDGLSRRYEGTGLGLSIVKGLVGLHKGRLDILSEPDMGTTVSVLLPLDGPSGMAGTNVQTFHSPRQTPDDEAKWLEDEKRSVAR